jgi:hypothetical protein
LNQAPHTTLFCEVITGPQASPSERGSEARVLESVGKHDAQVHRERGSLDERGQRRFEAPFGEDGGMNTAGQVAQLAKAAFELLSRSGEYRPGRLRVTVEQSVQQAQLERRGHEPLLRAVVEIALDLAACLVGGLNEPCARRRQLVPRFRVLDRI